MLLQGLQLVKETKEIDQSDTTKWYKVSARSQGRVGFITSMSSHFCGGCNRLRITADGKLKVCLFGQEETSLVEGLRAGLGTADMQEIVLAAVLRKKAKLGGHPTILDIAANNNRPMILIGG